MTRLLRPLAVLAILLLTVARVSAHRLDEYLQATLVSIEPGQFRFDINLTPGVDVADQLLRLIDRDGNSVISTNESAAYLELLKRELAVQLDGRDLNLSIAAFDFPAIEEIRTGVGIIQVEFTAPTGATRSGAHRLTFANHHLPRKSVYLFNAVLPQSPSVQIVRQTRNQNQSEGEIEFTINLASRWNASIFAGVLGFVVFAAACSTRKLAKFQIGSHRSSAPSQG